MTPQQSPIFPGVFDVGVIKRVSSLWSHASIQVTKSPICHCPCFGCHVVVVFHWRLHCNEDRKDMWLLNLHGHEMNTIAQVGGFFLIWTSGQVHWAGFAGVIIGLSDFRHPTRAAFWTMASYELLFSVLRAFRWPWGAFHDLDQSIPILASLLSVALLIGTSVFFAWFTPRFRAFFQKHFAH
jgi:hypothetical protein